MDSNAAFRAQVTALRRQLRTARANAARSKQTVERNAVAMDSAVSEFTEGVAARAKVRGIGKLRTSKTGSVKQRRLASFTRVGGLAKRLDRFARRATSTGKKARVSDQMSLNMAASEFATCGGINAVSRAYGVHRITCVRHAAVFQRWRFCKMI